MYYSDLKYVFNEVYNYRKNIVIVFSIIGASASVPSGFIALG